MPQEDIRLRQLAARQAAPATQAGTSTVKGFDSGKIFAAAQGAVSQKSKFLQAKLAAEKQAAKDAQNFIKDKITLEMNGLSIEAERKVKQARGTNAFSVFNIEREGLQKQYDEISTKYPAEYQDMVKGVAGKTITSFDRSNLEHTTSEYRSEQDAQHKARAEQTSKGAIGVATHNGSYISRVQELDDITARNAKLNGLEQDALKAHIEGARSQLFKSTVDVMVTGGQLDTARDFLERKAPLYTGIVDKDGEVVEGAKIKYIDQLTSKDKIAVNRLLQKGGQTKVLKDARNLAETVKDTYENDPDAMRAAIKTHDDPNVVERALVNLSRLFEEDKQKKEIKKEDDRVSAMREVEARIEAKKLTPAARDKILSSVHVDDQKAVEAFMDGKQKTDPKVVAKLDGLMESPQGLSKTNVEALKINLSEEDYKSYRGFKETTVRAKRGQVEDAVTASSRRVMPIINAVLFERDLNAIDNPQVVSSLKTIGRNTFIRVVEELTEKGITNSNQIDVAFKQEFRKASLPKERAGGEGFFGTIQDFVTDLADIGGLRGTRVFDKDIPEAEVEKRLAQRKLDIEDQKDELTDILPLFDAPPRQVKRIKDKWFEANGVEISDKQLQRVLNNKTLRAFGKDPLGIGE